MEGQGNPDLHAPRSTQGTYQALGVVTIAIGFIPAMVFLRNPDLALALAVAAFTFLLGAMCLACSRNPTFGNNL